MARAARHHSTQPVGHQKHIVTAFRNAGWIVLGGPPQLRVKCHCPDVHKTYIRPDATERYARDKLAWLYEETCFESL